MIQTIIKIKLFIQKISTKFLSCKKVTSVLKVDKYKNIRFKVKMSYKEHVKGILSIVLAALGIVLLWPFMVYIGAAIKLCDGGSILFCQERLGKDKKPFIIYKFKTMIVNKDIKVISGPVLEGDRRITKLGSVLRKTSLDELPQLFNILKGDMCFVGPRPIVKEEYDANSALSNVDQRFLVKPGLFCTVDIKLRATAQRKTQFEMDSEYVNTISFLKDLYIFIRVFFTVIRRKNVYSLPNQENGRLKDTSGMDNKGDLEQ
ncbi:MAG: sugar transferase [Anaerocolumna sp.]